MLRAVIDVGSNSLLLLVSEYDGKTWNPVHESTFVTALGKGTKTTQLLSPDGISATLKALKIQFEEAKSFNCHSIRAMATMAARIAKNTPEFLDLARSQGTPVEVLPGDEEARLGFLAIVNDPTFATNQVLSVIDVGGHSTELVTAEQVGGIWQTRFKKSFAIGALGLREGSLSADIPEFRDTLSAVEEIDSAIGLRYLPHRCGQAVTLGATGTNLVTIREKMTEWNPNRVHGQSLDYEEISKAVEYLSSLGDAGRAKVVGIEPGRQHTLHAGSLILERFMFAIGANSCQVSTRGWRHAYLETYQE